MIQSPAVFRRACRNLGPDLNEIVTTLDDLVQHSLIGIDQADGRELHSYLDELLSGRYSHVQLRDHFYSMPGTTKFHDGEAVAAFLSRMREVLSAPPYVRSGQ